MRLGYNTNGFAHHELLSALDVLADIGYRSVAITVDHRCLNPFERGLEGELERVAVRLRQLGMTSVIETGARYLLNPWIKHEPTLVSAGAGDRERRIGFLCRAIDIAAALGSDCVSLWSGAVRDDASEEQVWERLVQGVRAVSAYAEARQVTLGFEPEPGMFIDTMATFEEFLERAGIPHLQLTLDVGHLHCQGEVPIARCIRRWAGRIVNIHIEDMCAGVHEHLMFGEGEMDFPPILEALHQIGYQGGAHVELSRHSHDAPRAAQRAYGFLSPLLDGEKSA